MTAHISIEDLKLFDEYAYKIFRKNGIANLASLSDIILNRPGSVQGLSERKVLRLKKYLNVKKAQSKYCKTDEEVALYNIMYITSTKFGSYTFASFAECFARIRQALLNLDDKEQKVIILRFFENKTLDEVRNATRKSVNTGYWFNCVLGELYLNIIGEKVGKIYRNSRIDDIWVFSSKIYYWLENIGVNTFEQLLAISDKQILSIPGVGPAQLAKFREYKELKKKALNL